MAQQTIAEKLIGQLLSQESIPSDTIIKSKARWNSDLYYYIFYSSHKIENFDTVIAYADTQISSITGNNLRSIINYAPRSVIAANINSLREKIDLSQYQNYNYVDEIYDRAAAKQDDEMIDILFQLGYRSARHSIPKIFYGVSLQNGDKPRVDTDQEKVIISFMQKTITRYGKKFFIQNIEDYNRLLKVSIDRGMFLVLDYVIELINLEPEVAQGILHQENFSEIMQSVIYSSSQYCSVPIKESPVKLLHLINLIAALPSKKS